MGVKDVRLIHHAGTFSGTFTGSGLVTGTRLTGTGSFRGTAVPILRGLPIWLIVFLQLPETVSLFELFDDVDSWDVIA